MSFIGSKENRMVYFSVAVNQIFGTISCKRFRKVW